MKNYVNLSRLLLENNIITTTQYDHVKSIQTDRGIALELVIIDEKIVDSKTIFDSILKNTSYPELDLTKYRPNVSIAKTIPENVCKRQNILVIGIQGETIKLAASDPLNLSAIHDVRILTGKQVDVFVADAEVLRDAIKEVFSTQKIIGEITDFITESVVLDTNNTVGDDTETPVARFLNMCFERAVELKASDIHIEPFETELVVRARVDSALIELYRMESTIQSSLVSRIKILSKLNITERRLPQDGTIKLVISNQHVTMRVSTFPVAFGEKVVLRVIYKNVFDTSKQNLGFNEEELVKFEKMLQRPNGIILTTGPTGSGKTTTLYSAIEEIKLKPINITTLEDPIESIIKGVNQMQVNEKIDLTFARGLRSVLRQDPDVILVGEIRDEETANIATRAAITGHLVLSTIHTNDAASTIMRLTDMNIPPYILSAGLTGIIAQRLIRKVCSNCKEEIKLNESEKELCESLGINVDTHHFGKGCGLCNYTGYKGRIAIFEVMEITPEIKVAISKNLSTGELQKIAVSQGMITLKENVIKHFKVGDTTIDEIYKIVLD